MALARLSKTKDSIAQVAADLGYADTSAFYRAFVEWTGIGAGATAGVDGWEN